MTDTLYSLMDWAAIEELVYSEASDPHRLLGPHIVPQGILIQAFIPTAAAVTVHTAAESARTAAAPVHMAAAPDSAKRQLLAEKAQTPELLKELQEEPREKLRQGLQEEPRSGLRKEAQEDLQDGVAQEESWPMELADEAGFFAALLPGETIPSYTLEVTYDNGTVQTIHDPYAYGPQLAEADLKKFDAGVHYHVYEKLGAHPMEIGGVAGTYFAVWAPCAMRVSVVGDFNLWDGRRHQMRRLGSYGVFELFIPGVAQGAVYKYEVKAANGIPMLKADPYGTYAEVRPHNASIVWDVSHFEWHDQEWMARRAEGCGTAKQAPMSVYEVHLGSWMRAGRGTDADNAVQPAGAVPERPEDAGAAAQTAGAAAGFLNYRELAVKLAAYVKEMGYTHVELMPVMEHPLDASLGYQITGYYAPTSRHGSPDDFQYFMDYMHGQGIGVILDWAPAQFPRDLVGLACFDGSCVYEHKDPRQGTHPQWGTLIFNYRRLQVANFLIANAVYWAEVYHADGIRADSVSAMLYLDYGKAPGQWIPNIYGGNENLDAVDFLKRLAACFHKREDGAVLIAEESTAWPQVTGGADEALGFDYKWNSGWLEGLLGYMRYDPYFRHQRYGELTFSLLYAYSEEFILAFPHNEMGHGRGSMVSRMPGETLDAKLANLRAAYGYWMTHPGKKLLFMGQDMGMTEAWDENVSLPWDVLDSADAAAAENVKAAAEKAEEAAGTEQNTETEAAGAEQAAAEMAMEAAQAAHEQRVLQRQFRQYVKALLHFYRSHPALYALDDQPEGFEWIDCLSSQENILVYLRRSASPEETLLVVCNFAPVAHEKRRIGVPFHGKYKEIFNSDAAEYGGSGRVNPRAAVSRPIECDGREESVSIRLAPLGVQIFHCIRDAG